MHAFLSPFTLSIGFTFFSTRFIFLLLQYLSFAIHVLAQISFNDMMPPPQSLKYIPTLGRSDRNNHSYEYVINK
jgi:hypothetical protein